MIARGISPYGEVLRALRTFNADTFCQQYGGRKESRSPLSFEYLFRCPLPRCGSSNLRWNAQKGAFVCWGCRVSGSTLYLIQLLGKMELSDAMDFVLGQYVGGDASLDLSTVATMRTPVTVAREPDMLPPIALPALAVPAVQSEVVRAYLHSRGIDDRMMHVHGLLAGTQGRELHHVIFPCRMDGRVVYWQARACWDPPKGLSKEDRKAWIETHAYRKTLNPRNGFPGVPQATAADALFGFDSARLAPHVVIVEGPVDAIKVGTHAIALLGKGSDAKIARLRRLAARRVTLYLDRGEQEQAAALRIAGALAGLTECWFAVPPPGFDAGDLTPGENAAILSAAVPVAQIGLKSTLTA